MHVTLCISQKPTPWGTGYPETHNMVIQNKNYHLQVFEQKVFHIIHVFFRMVFVFVIYNWKLPLCPRNKAYKTTFILQQMNSGHKELLQSRKLQAKFKDKEWDRQLWDYTKSWFAAYDSVVLGSYRIGV